MTQPQATFISAQFWCCEKCSHDRVWGSGLQLGPGATYSDSSNVVYVLNKGDTDYKPVLFCEHCQRQTRHWFKGYDIHTFINYREQVNGNTIRPNLRRLGKNE